jgi:hypothetical protein
MFSFAEGAFPERFPKPVFTGKPSTIFSAVLVK